jgi:hypothetical protein
VLHEGIAIMPTIVSEELRSTNWRHQSLLAFASRWRRAFIASVRRSYLAAFPPELCTVGKWLIAEQYDLSKPSPPSAPASGIALKEGALLYETDGEPCSSNVVA